MHPTEVAQTRTRPMYVALVASLVLATGALIAVTGGNVAVAMLPALGCAALAAMVRLPLKYTVLAVMGATLLFHNPGARPHDGFWTGPLYGVGQVIYNNLRTLVGVDALRFNTIELVLFLLVSVLAVRWFVGSSVDGPVAEGSASPLKRWLLVSLLAVVASIAWGLVRGGDFKQLLWQTRQLGWAPVLGVLFLRALRSPASHDALVTMVVGVAVVRALDALYFFFAVARPQGLWVEYAITHDDSMLFVSVLMFLGIWALETRSRRAWLTLAWVGPLVFAATLVNTRRLAYVSLAACVLTTFWALRAPIQRRIVKWTLLALPVVALYVGVGLNSRSAIFAPVRSLASVTDEENASNETRHVENFNLVHTLRQHPVLGSGFGHEYVELVKTYSIADAMPNYRYIAHNSVLWLWGLMGLIGFTLAWTYLPVTVFLAARTYRAAQDARVRVASLTAICVVIVYMFQAYGDMGMISWMGSFLLASAVGVVGTNAVRHGGWSRI